jgi:subtilisin family serine protease
MKALIAAWLAGCLVAGVGAAEPAALPATPNATVAQQVLVLLQLPSAHFRPDGNYTGVYANTLGSAARRRYAQSLARAHGLSLATDWPLPMLGLDCYVMEVPAAQDPDAVADQLGRDPRVVWVQRMHQFRPLAHDDPLFGMQPAAREWQLDELHAAATGRDIRVATIDSGVQLDHPDLKGQIALDIDLVGAVPYAAEDHGTAVAGIIVARANNHVGIAGVAPQARLLALRACWQAAPSDTQCNTLSLARALHAAIEHGAQVVNLSLGGPPDRLIRQLVELAMARGIGVVAAANRSAAGGGFPAAIGGVIAVTDTSAQTPDGLWVAPGIDIPTTLPVSRWATVTGASYASAHVSGLLALMLDAQSRAGTARTPVANDLVRRPDGRVDACASLSRAGSACACACSGGSPTALMAPH